MDGGADDEVTLRRNTSAFDDYELLSTQLSDISDIDMQTEVLGQKINRPAFLSPTGANRLFHHEKEPAAAQAAKEFGTIYSLSTLATTTIEDIVSVTDGPIMYQI